VLYLLLEEMTDQHIKEVLLAFFILMQSGARGCAQRTLRVTLARFAQSDCPADSNADEVNLDLHPLNASPQLRAASRLSRLFLVCQITAALPALIIRHEYSPPAHQSSQPSRQSSPLVGPWGSRTGRQGHVLGPCVSCHDRQEDAAELALP